MGAWSHEPFGNDTASDWSDGMLESEDLSPVESALDVVIETADEYLEVDQASEAIAAVEVIAKLLGKGTQSDASTEDIDKWVKNHPQMPSSTLLQKARQAIKRIQQPNSELLELWEEGGEPAEWNASLEKLLVAIGA